MSKFIILMWVSGSWKTTVLNESGILHDKRFEYVQSYTTRPLREWEVNWVKYYHISDAEFERSIMAGEFLEYALVHRLYNYGSKIASVTSVIDQWRYPIKEIDMYGLVKIQEQTSLPFSYASIFLDIPNSVMVQRINNRGLLSASELQERIKSAEFEREQAQKRCDVIIDASQPLELVVETFIHAVDTLIG